MKKIVIVGGGGHAEVLVSVLNKLLTWQVVGYTDLHDRGAILGAPYLGDDSVLPQVIERHESCSAIIAGMGKIDASAKRLHLQQQVEALGFTFPVIISPHAVVNVDVVLGPGTAVLDGVVMNSGTVAGSSCIINTGSIVEHDCRLGDNIHVASGAIVGGGVTIGSNCLIGTGATLIQGLTICADTLIGAGAIVIRDIEVAGTYTGNPATRIR